MEQLKKTPLFEKHLENNAKMVDFGGWNMPIQYKGIIEEHKNTRNNVSIFDVSHMGEFIVKGKDSKKFLNYITTNNIEKLYDGKAQYSSILYKNGTFIDDIIVYRINELEYQICVNASNINKDFNWFKEQSLNFDVELKNISENVALIAIQGPKSINVVQKILDEDLSKIKYYEFKKILIQGQLCIIARMGYTGEDGFEIFIPANKAIFFWDLLIEKGKEFNIMPAGLGARDTLRLEVGFSLYGNDIDDMHTPLEAGLEWIVDLKKDFIGKEILLEQKINGLSKKLCAFKILEKGIARTHYKIFSFKNTENFIGEVCSGTFSPMLNYGIGLSYLPIEESKIGNKILIDLRGKMVEAEILKLPFYKREN